jgi:uncharacterized LabA/DUF88 family protein
MPDKAVESLASDPSARVMVLIDGQNLYKTCREEFGHPLCHPHLLAEHLAGPRTKSRVACRFYTGRPDANKPAEVVKARNLDRRLSLIRRHGATIITRKLRYHWDWGHKQNLPPPAEDAEPQEVTLTPWERPQEKGIDVLIALDTVEFILTNVCDVAIVVSFDRDLREIPEALRNLKKLIGRPYRLEAAVPGRADDFPRTLPGFNHTHQLTPELFERIRDDTNYTVRPSRWTPPKFPSCLADLEGD